MERQPRGHGVQSPASRGFQVTEATPEGVRTTFDEKKGS